MSYTAKIKLQISMISGAFRYRNTVILVITIFRYLYQQKIVTLHICKYKIYWTSQYGE